MNTIKKIQFKSNKLKMLTRFEHTLVKWPNKVNPLRKPATGLSCLQLGLVLAFLDAFRDTTDGGLCRLCVVGA